MRTSSRPLLVREILPCVLECRRWGRLGSWASTVVLVSGGEGQQWCKTSPGSVSQRGTPAGVGGHRIGSSEGNSMCMLLCALVIRRGTGGG
jgi:hypothetical protein